ncbi:MAG: hypothetical protein JWR33_258 [Naasia sp.]|uniref:hypothetical protein n=1 Tax=Naasia sp. TaxID=2546198 RepID=UPI00261C2C2F|nr:hypothetical protein [Naasia sp.]MCU1569517.1 hypothetical protein [Naasia sp.]
MTESLKHDELPLPEYDHIPLGMLGGRIAPLDAEGVGQLLDYEREHGNRLPIVQILEHRIEALQNGAESSGTITDAFPEMSQGQAGSQVTPATSGPVINPPSHGDPTNPAQPR